MQDWPSRGCRGTQGPSHLEGMLHSPRKAALLPRDYFQRQGRASPPCFRHVRERTGAAQGLCLGLDFHPLVSCPLTLDSRAGDALLGWSQMKGDGDIHG